MRIDHIENFNLACATVGKLAAEAIAEHRRQIEQLETVGREAAKLVREQPREEARKIDLPRADVESPLTLSVPSFDDRMEATSADLDQGQPEEHIEDLLSVAMRRADREPDPAAMHLDNLRRRRAAEFASAKDNRAAEALDDVPLATPVENGATGDEDVLARGRDLVSSLRKRGRR